MHLDVPGHAPMDDLWRCIYGCSRSGVTAYALHVGFSRFWTGLLTTALLFSKCKFYFTILSATSVTSTAQHLKPATSYCDRRHKQLLLQQNQTSVIPSVTEQGSLEVSRCILIINLLHSLHCFHLYLPRIACAGVSVESEGNSSSRTPYPKYLARIADEVIWNIAGWNDSGNYFMMQFQCQFQTFNKHPGS